MKTDMELLHEFQTDVGNALNAKGVKLPDGADHGAVMLVLSRNITEHPIGGAFNFEDGKWVFMEQLADIVDYED